MRILKALRGVGLAAGLTIGLLLSMTGAALAAGTKVCVPAAAETAIVTASTSGTCKAGYTKTTMLPEAEQEKLEQLLPYVNFVKEGIDKKPTVQISGANLQVINGLGKETEINGLGNLILGYDEAPGTQTGSHNLLLGGTGNSYSSYGGIVGGFSNTISSSYASILGGAANASAAVASTITGGYSNKASTNYSTVNGGCSNLAGTGTLVVSSACTTAHIGYFTSILGGTGNQAEAESSSVTGGSRGKATYRASTVLGGLEEVTEKEFGVTP